MSSFAPPIRFLAVASVALAVIAPASASGAFDPRPSTAAEPASQRSMPTAPSAAAVAALLRPLGGPILGRAIATNAGPDVAFSPSAAAAALAAQAAPEPSSVRRAASTRSTASTRHAGSKTASRQVAHHATAPPRYRGTNHVWIPSLGVDRSIAWFPCSRSTPPGLAVYRWGCAGANNVYLFAHAYAAFKPLHDAYVSGRLRKGMKVVYADGRGRVRTYAVAWWRLTTPDRGEFAYAALSRPSLTLQTCVGARSQYRLIVRLVGVG
ncbi:MAG TPA: sortase [Candidatus Limnocylindrales bacterium]|nr:sortase [Candidatus Limnocylindrales bacterium]